MVQRIRVRIEEIYEIRRISDIEFIVPDGCENEAIEEVAVYTFKNGQVAIKTVQSTAEAYDAQIDKDPIRIETEIILKEPV